VALNAGLVGRTRRGIAGQQQRRRAESRLRRRVLAFVRWAQGWLGWSRACAAATLGLSERTLRDWQRRRREQPRVVPRGRPAHRSDQATRQEVIAQLQLTGPRVTYAEMERLFPDIPRTELHELTDRFRHVCRVRWGDTVIATRWTTSGSVWAMDHTQPPCWIDGLFPKILVVRDLASGCTLAALPVPDERHVDVVGLLRRLFHEHGAPLVMKHDNGSAFVHWRVQRELRHHGVTALFSPPGTPQYNGACEAGIGGLKTRCQHRATRCDRPEAWTCDDVEFAVQSGNAYGRPDGRGTPTHAELWAQRPDLAPALRAAFRADVAQQLEELAAARGAICFEALDPADARTVERVAISFCLRAHGLLQFRRRRDPLSFRRKKAAIIS